MCIHLVVVSSLFLAAGLAASAAEPVGAPLPGTAPLTWTDDITSRLVDGVDRFLLDKLEKSVDGRAKYWRRDTASAERYNASVEPNRKRLAHILGVRDARVAFDAPESPEPIGRPPFHGVPPESQFARRLAESGCRVIVPALIDRGTTIRKLSNREYLYRPAFELGRHLIGYEVQKVLAAVDWLDKEGGPIGVVGWGEGGMLALAAGAIDPRIDAVCVSGYFDDRRDLWREPLDRNVFGLVEQFGDAEIASLVAPRALIVEASKGPEHVVPPGTGGGPGRLTTPRLDAVRAEVERAREFVKGLKPEPRIELVVSGEGEGPYGTPKALGAFLDALVAGSKLADLGKEPTRHHVPTDVKARQRAQMHEIDRHNQWLLTESPYVRQQFMAKLDTSALKAYEKSVEWYRDYFAEEVIGRFDDKLMAPNVRSRQVFDEPKFRGYEVVMDVFPDVIAFGILLLPKDLKDGEKRPVVVCQHGLEGRPRDVADPSIENPAYHKFAVQLAERGFITFSPQNLYIFQDRFRTLQRKANPLGKTLFSIMVPQHQQITDWLKTLPSVDPARIGFYGLSYGGKSAMRIPPLVKNYALSICSADFNEWVWKNASSRSPYSYVPHMEYEIFEFDLGSTFNYSEMAALIAPRPFMVERGHFDGVAPDETVAYEFAKVRFLYEAKLGLVDQAEIEWFVGPHTIHGVGTFDFLHKHLRWPKR